MPRSLINNNYHNYTNAHVVPTSDHLGPFNVQDHIYLNVKPENPTVPKFRYQILSRYEVVNTRKSYIGLPDVRFLTELSDILSICPVKKNGGNTRHACAQNFLANYQTSSLVQCNIMVSGCILYRYNSSINLSRKTFG